MFQSYTLSISKKLVLIMNATIKLFFGILKNCYGGKSHQLYFEFKIILAKILRQLSRPPFPSSDAGNTNLHLGCGSINHPEFINIDGAPFSHVHYVRAIDDLSPFKDETINLIYASHCLEHFSYLEVPNILLDWFRKLKPGGILRLSVPDFEQIVCIYLENDRNIDTIIGPLMGGQGNKFDFHQIVFNSRKLKELLIDAGFKDVREWCPHSSKPGDLDDWSVRQIPVSGKHYSISLNLEAIK